MSHHTQSESSRKCHAATRASSNSLRIILNTDRILPYLRHTYFFRCLRWRPVTSHYCPESQNLVDDYLVEKTCIILSVNQEAELKSAFCQHRDILQF